MGLKEREISWGKPTKTEPKVQTFSLDRVKQIQLVIDNNSIDLASLPASGKKINLQFQFTDADDINIPFTEVPMAAEWTKFLKSSIAPSQIDRV